MAVGIGLLLLFAREAKGKKEIRCHGNSLPVLLCGTGFVHAEAFSRHFLAESPEKEHHIFMQTVAVLRSVSIGCSDARCSAALLLACPLTIVAVLRLGYIR